MIRPRPMLDEIVSKFSDAHFLAILFAAIGSAATVLTAAMPWLQPDTLSRRIKAVSSERERIRARERERLQAAQSKTTLRVRPSGLVKQVVETLNLSSWLSTEKAKMQLAMNLLMRRMRRRASVSCGSPMAPITPTRKVSKALFDSM